MSTQHLAPPSSSKHGSSLSSSPTSQHHHASSSSSSSHHHHHSHHSSSNATIPTASLVEPPALFATVAPHIFRSATPTPASHSFLRTLQLKTILSLTAELPSPSLTAFCKKNGIKFLHFGLKRWGTEDVAYLSETPKVVTGGLHNHEEPFPSASDREGELANPLDLSFLHAIKSPSPHPLSTTNTPTSASTAATTTTPFFSTLSTSSHFTSSSSPTLTEELVKDSLQILLNSTYHPVLVTDTSGIHEIGVLLGCLRKLQRWNFATILLEYRHFAGNRARATNERFVEMFDTDLITYPEEELPFWFAEQLREDEAELDRVEGRI